MQSSVICLIVWYDVVHLGQAVPCSSECVVGVCLSHIKVVLHLEDFGSVHPVIIFKALFYLVCRVL